MSEHTERMGQGAYRTPATNDGAAAALPVNHAPSYRTEVMSAVIDSMTAFAVKFGDHPRRVELPPAMYHRLVSELASVRRYGSALRAASTDDILVHCVCGTVAIGCGR